MSGQVPLPTPGAVHWQLDSQAIRNELLSTPGARVCPFDACQVVTQGGEEGEQAHKLHVHGIVASKRLR